MKEALSDAKSNLAKAQEQMKRRVDKARRTEEWAVGDRVLLSTQNLQMFAPHLPLKLKRRWVGPFNNCQSRQPSCLPVEFASRVADSSNISCQ